MDSFFASCEQQANPRLRGRPIGVSGDPKSRTVVAAASKEAKKFGVRSAMTIGDARRLCPQIQFILGDPDKYVEVSRRIIAILGSFTPDVEVTSIDEAFLDVTGWAERYACAECLLTGPAATDPHRARMLRAVGDPPFASPARISSCGAARLAQEIKRRIAAEVGEWITCSVGIAPNKRLAKLASEFNKPNGLVLVYAHDPPIAHADVRMISRADLLASLQLRDLCGIGARIEARLAGIGITTIGALAAAPLDLLTEEFGSYGYELHDMAFGYDASPVEADDADPKSMGHAVTLPRDLKTLGEIRPVVEELSEKVAARLRRHGFRGSTLHITVRFRDFTSRSEQTTMFDATDDGLRISREVMRILESWLKRRGGIYSLPRAGMKPAPTTTYGLSKPVRLIGITVAKLVRSNPAQAPLFPRDRRWQAAIAALDAANNRYGDWTVQRASLLQPRRYLRKVAAAFQSTRHLR